MTHTISENMSVHNQTQWSHKLICDIGRGRQDMRNDITFKVIQGQGHGPFTVAKMADSEVYLLRHLMRYPEYC